MKHRIRGAAGAAALVLLLGAAACGDDDDPESTEDTAPEGGGAGVEAACSALIDFNGAVLGLEIDETSSEEDVKAAGADLAELFAPIAENAPEGLSDAVSELEAVFDDMAEGDAEAFNSEESFITYTEFVGGLSGECGYNEVAVTGVDYGYEGLGDTLEAGPTTISFTNGSDAEEHELLLVKKADGVALSFEEIIELPEEESESMIEFMGAAFAPPGGESGTIADLTPGEYLAICFIPVGGSEDGPPHFTQGMMHEFTVE